MVAETPSVEKHCSNQGPPSLPPAQVAQQPEENQQELRAKLEELHGSWGSWGAWSTCSRTCGSGVQEQSRPCLPVYSHSQHSSRRVGVHSLQPGRVISALRPSVPLRSDAGSSSDGSRGEQREETHTPHGGRRYCSIKCGQTVEVAEWLFKKNCKAQSTSKH